MSLTAIFGIGDRKIIEENRYVSGVICDVKTCWWLKVNTKAVRSGPTDGARFPHIAVFRYSVDGREYTGRRYFSYTLPRPAVGAALRVYYDAQNPGRWAVKPR